MHQNMMSEYQDQSPADISSLLAATSRVEPDSALGCDAF